MLLPPSLNSQPGRLAWPAFQAITILPEFERGPVKAFSIGASTGPSACPVPPVGQPCCVSLGDGDRAQLDPVLSIRSEARGSR